MCVLDRAKFIVHFSISLVRTLEVVSIRRGLLQACVRDVCFFTGVDAWLEKVGHEDDLEDTRRGFRKKSVNYESFRGVLCLKKTEFKAMNS